MGVFHLHHSPTWTRSDSWALWRQLPWHKGSAGGREEPGSLKRPLASLLLAPGPWLAASSALARPVFPAAARGGPEPGMGRPAARGLQRGAQQPRRPAREWMPDAAPRGPQKTRAPGATAPSRRGSARDCRPKDRTAPGSPGSPTGWHLVSKPGSAPGAHLAAATLRPLPCSPAEGPGLASAPPTAPPPPSPGDSGAVARSSSQPTLVQEPRRCPRKPPSERPAFCPQSVGGGVLSLGGGGRSPREASQAAGWRARKPQGAQPLAAKRSARTGS